MPAGGTARDRIAVDVIDSGEAASIAIWTGHNQIIADLDQSQAHLPWIAQLYPDTSNQTK
jgi:hypothetical protein